MTCAPISVIATKPSIVWICHVWPKRSIGPVASTTMPMIPRRSRKLPGNEVQPARAVQEHEADVAPGITEAVQLRLADPRVVVDRHLAHGEPAAVRLEDHLRRELHPGRVEVEYRKRLAADRAHPAVRVGDLHAEEHVEHASEDRVADEAVEERHRVAVDRSLEAGADHEVVAASSRSTNSLSSSSGYVSSASPMTMNSPRAASAPRGTHCHNRGGARRRRSLHARQRLPRRRRSRRCRRRPPRRRARIAGFPRTPGRRPSRRPPPRSSTG